METPIAVSIQIEKLKGSSPPANAPARQIKNS